VSSVDPNDSLRRAEAYLTQQGSALQRSLATALLTQQSLAPAQAEALLVGQQAEGGWPAFWSSGRCSVDATAYRITQALAAGLSLAGFPALDRAATWLAYRQQRDGRWQEDAALASDAPPWARPGDTAATLYLTANAGWTLARCGYAPNATQAARALAAQLDADGALSSFAQTQWLAAGLWLLRGERALADRVLTLASAHMAAYSASELVWSLNCLLDSELERAHPLITNAIARLRSLQQADGAWPSDDGPSFTPQVTLEAMRALSLVRA